MKIFENISKAATLALPLMGLLTDGLPTTRNNLNNPGQQPALLHSSGNIENSTVSSSNMYSAASSNLRDGQQNLNLGHPAPSTPINNPSTYASSQNNLSKTSSENNPINSPTSPKSSIQSTKPTNIWNYSLGSYIQSENFLYNIMNIIYSSPEIKNTITLQNIKKEIADAKHVILEFQNKVIIGRSELMAAKFDENISTLKGVYGHFKNNFIQPIAEIIGYYSNEINNGHYAIENLNIGTKFVNYLSENYTTASLANKQIEYNKILEMFPQDIEKMRYTKGIILNMGELISNTAIILKEIGNTISINEDINSPLNTNIDSLLEKSANLLNSLQSFDPNNLDTCIKSHKNLISEFNAISNIYINIVKVLSADVDNYLHKMAKEIVNSENSAEIFNDISKKCINSLNSLDRSLQTAMEQSIVSLNIINKLTKKQNDPYNIIKNNPEIVNTDDIIANLQKNYNTIANRDLAITPANPSSSSASSNSENPADSKKNETAVPEKPVSEDPSSNSPAAINPEDSPSEDNNNDGPMHAMPEGNDEEASHQNAPENNNSETAPQNPTEDNNNNEYSHKNTSEGDNNDDNESFHKNTSEGNDNKTPTHTMSEGNNAQNMPDNNDPTHAMSEGSDNESSHKNTPEGNEGPTHTISKNNNETTAHQNTPESSGGNENKGPTRTTSEDNNNKITPQNTPEGSGGNDEKAVHQITPESNNNEAAPQNVTDGNDNETTTQIIHEGSGGDDDDDETSDNTQMPTVKTLEEPVTQKTEQENNYADYISEEKPVPPPASTEPEPKDTSKTPIQSPTPAINNQEENNTHDAPVKIHENKPSTQEDSNRQPPTTATSGSSTSQENKIPSQTPAISSDEDTLQKSSSADPVIPEKSSAIQKNTLPTPALNPSLNINKHESASPQEASTTSKSSEAPTKPKDTPTMAPEKAQTPTTTEETKASAHPPLTNPNKNTPTIPAEKTIGKNKDAENSPTATNADSSNKKTKRPKTSHGKTKLNRKTEGTSKRKPTNNLHKEDPSTKTTPETPKITEDSSNPSNNTQSTSGTPSSMASLPSMVIAGAALYLAHNNR
ncbi:hypothetical protein NEIRO03_0361 [Nematocida sp. AWRm78]|nr:hypothetical protein NEIRO02_0395 [Nematocida sp. AWRm79]KAI5182710.1 hypothetical protein NEIRO03_0361 [Nematocida sp. AWRm78]